MNGPMKKLSVDAQVRSLKFALDHKNMALYG
jgi:hypothetical protein